MEKRTLVNHKVAERKAWAKFGAEKGSKPGPDNATTTVGENVSLKLHAGPKVRDHISHTKYCVDSDPCLCHIAFRDRASRTN